MSLPAFGLLAVWILQILSGVPLPLFLCLFAGLPVLLALLQYRLCADGYDPGLRQLPPLVTGIAALLFRAGAVLFPDLSLLSQGGLFSPVSDWDLLTMSAGACLVGMIAAVLTARRRAGYR